MTTVHCHWIVLVKLFTTIIFLLTTVILTSVNRSVIIEWLGNEAIYWGSVSVLWIICITLLMIHWLSIEFNQLIITSKSVSRIRLSGIFSLTKKTIYIEQIEEVNTDTKGVLQEGLGYGTLKIHNSKDLIHMRYCPMPEKYVKTIRDLMIEYIDNKGRPGMQKK